MSGPKTVRYLTQAELEVHCRSLIERVRTISNIWLAQLKNAGLQEEEDNLAVQRMVANLERYLDEGETQEVQKNAPNDEAWLERQFNKRVDARAKHIEMQKTLTRRRRSAVSTVLSTIKLNSVEVPKDILSTLEAARDGNEKSASVINKAVREAFDALSPDNEVKSLTKTQRRLAQSLGVDAESRSYANWLSEAAPKDDASGLKLDHHLTNLSARYGAKKIVAFKIRAEDLEQVGSPSHRKLLIDSLVIELAAFARAEAIYDKELLEAKVVLAQLGQYPDALGSVSKQLASALTGNRTELSASIEVCKTALQSYLSEWSRTEKRRKLLYALSALGYSVEEGMETAFAEEGKIFLEKTTQPGFGVALTGLQATDSLKLQAMKFEDVESNAAIDKEHETQWCGDFSTLRAAISNQGDNIIIEKALAVGARPLKIAARAQTNQRKSKKMSQKIR